MLCSVERKLSEDKHTTIHGWLVEGCAANHETYPCPTVLENRLYWWMGMQEESESKEAQCDMQLSSVTSNTYRIFKVLLILLEQGKVGGRCDGDACRRQDKGHNETPRAHPPRFLFVLILNLLDLIACRYRRLFRGAAIADRLEYVHDCLLACLLGPTTPTLWTDYVANVICGDLPQLAVVNVVEICDATPFQESKESSKDCVLHFHHHQMPKYNYIHSQEILIK
jgi:hypothetical protein